MKELFLIVLALASGIGLGLLYFGGLWLTVRQLPTTRHPALLTLGSFCGRSSIILVGFYLVTGSHWERLMFCLLTFLWTRNVIVQRLQSDLTTLKSRSRRRSSHAYQS